MFVLTTLVYPVVLAALCIGAGLLVDRCSGGWLPGLLLPAVGAAALIGVSQLITYVSPVAPATPYAMAAVAAAGLVLGRRRVRMLAPKWRAWRWQLVAPTLAYVLALAPVLLAGRPTFSYYLALSDSALHMLGADFLIHHGQDYAHLDLSNSYGRYINAYYNTSYPSGSDTLFGGSAFLLGLPLIWAFQPFNAFMLATATGPAWLLLRRMGLDGGWAALGALTATLPALVYAYELIGSIKEITSLPMILTLGVLVVAHPDWLRRGPSGAIPFALVVAGGVSALGVGFGPGRSRRRRSCSCPWSATVARRRGHAAGAPARWDWGDRRAPGRPAHVARALRIPAGGQEHRLNAQPGQPPHAASRHSGARRLALGSYKQLPAGDRPDGHLRAHRDHPARLPRGRRARHPQPAVCAGGLARADARRVARLRRSTQPPGWTPRS